MSLVVGGCRIGFEGASDSGVFEDSGAESDADPTQPDADPSLPAGLVSRWSFEDNSQNSLPNGPPASCIGVCPEFVGGASGSAYSFGGAGCLQVENDGRFELGLFTVVASFRQRVSAQAVLQMIVAKPRKGTNSPHNAWAMQVTDQRFVSFESHDSVGKSSVESAAASLGQWHRAAIVWDGTQKRVHLDGITTAVNGTAPSPLPEDDIYIGCELDGGSIQSFFEGEIDEVYIFDRALSDQEIAAL